MADTTIGDGETKNMKKEEKLFTGKLKFMHFPTPCQKNQGNKGWWNLHRSKMKNIREETGNPDGKREKEVGIQLPTVEVRFKNLTVEADVYVGTRSLPTLLNAARNIVESVLGMIGVRTAKQTKLEILKDASGIVKPSRPTIFWEDYPFVGTCWKARPDIKDEVLNKMRYWIRWRVVVIVEVDGEVTYNGHQLNEFVPRKTSAYISQNDIHTGLLTVRETLQFSARCQGVGSRYELLTELARREKDTEIHPDPEVDLFMKATAMEGVQSNLIVDYTLRILGLDVCHDTLVGDELQRGISGGQKKRVTTG
ncbi:transcription factor [Ancistrocladus abbreviatus]